MKIKKQKESSVFLLGNLYKNKDDSDFVSELLKE